MRQEPEMKHASLSYFILYLISQILALSRPESNTALTTIKCKQTSKQDLRCRRTDPGTSGIIMRQQTTEKMLHTCEPSGLCLPRSPRLGLTQPGNLGDRKHFSSEEHVRAASPPPTSTPPTTPFPARLPQVTVPSVHSSPLQLCCVVFSHVDHPADSSSHTTRRMPPRIELTPVPFKKLLGASYYHAYFSVSLPSLSVCSVS
jgi:hypothetical protein